MGRLKHLLHTVYYRCRHYGHLIVILVWTIFFGITLLLQNKNLFERMQINDDRFSTYFFGALMILLPILKVVAVVMYERLKDRKWLRIKKWTLIAIATIWLLITWAYAINGIPNVGYVMSSFVAVSAYVELGRGAYSD